MIITLCGSARFEKEFLIWKEVLGLAGHAVFDLCVYPSQKQGQKDWYTKEEKKALDSLHFRKIDCSAAVVILNKDGYVGPSTRNELNYSLTCSASRVVPIYAIEPESINESGCPIRVLSAFYLLSDSLAARVRAASQ